MAEIKWIKLAVDIFSNRKIMQMQTIPKGDSIILIWIRLLCLAGEINSGGRLLFTDSKPYDCSMLALQMNRPLQLMKQAINTFEDYGMIENIDGCLCIKNWEKYQSIDKMLDIREYNRAAKQRSRSKKMSTSEMTNLNNMSLTKKENVNDMSLTCQPCQETEEEREEEGDKEKEYHSFTLSNAREEILQNENHASGEECNAVENSLSDIFSARKTLQGIGKSVVMLSDAQMNDLLERLSLEEFNRYVGVIADNELSGKHYRRRTHYQAILDMAKKDRRLNGV